METKEIFLKLSEEGTYTAKTSFGELPVGKGGFKPMELLLVSLAGCSGVDVYEILKKKRQEVKDIEIRVEGERRDKHPRIYERIRIKYIVKGNVKEEALRQAIELSIEKYCSVYAMLKETAKIEVEQEIWED